VLIRPLDGANNLFAGLLLTCEAAKNQWIEKWFNESMELVLHFCDCDYRQHCV